MFRLIVLPRAGKDFHGWHMLKQNLDNRQGASIPTIKEREIWWCSIGVNVGDEEDGHNELYNRPVLIVRKFNARIFWGVAMTTQMKDDPCYFPCFFRFHALLQERESGGVAIANLYVYYKTLIIDSQ